MHIDGNGRSRSYTPSQLGRRRSGRFQSPTGQVDAQLTLKLLERPQRSVNGYLCRQDKPQVHAMPMHGTWNEGVSWSMSITTNCVVSMHVRMVSMPSACAALRFLHNSRTSGLSRRGIEGRACRMPEGRCRDPYIPRSSKNTASLGWIPLRSQARRYIPGSGFLFTASGRT